MITKLAVLIIEKADGTLTLSAGEKGDVIFKAKDLIRKVNDSGDASYARVTALGEIGVLKQRRWKQPGVVATEDLAEGADADELRAALKQKGVSVPPRISIENLINLAIKNGVKV